MRRRAAFTLTETLIAFAVGLVVLGLVAELARFAARSFHSAGARLEARERAHAALVTLRVALADASALEVATSGTRLAFGGARGAGEVALDGGRLTLRRPGESRASTLAPAVTGFAASWARPGLLRLELALAGRRFTDDVWMPAVGLRASDQPFNP